MTVQAPQFPVSQPMCVPLSARTSRMKCTKSVRESTVRSCVSPLIVTVIGCAVPPSLTAVASSRHRLAHGSPCDHARHAAPVVGGRVCVGRRRQVVAVAHSLACARHCLVAGGPAAKTLLHPGVP